MTNHQNHRYEVAKKTSFVNAGINLLLATLKVLIGSIGHSSALIADGIHSFSDLITDALVLFAAKAGMRDPDSGHPYGHQRIETFAAIIISMVFVAAGISIIYEAVHNLVIDQPAQTPTLAVFIVAILSVVANEFLFRYTLKKGKAIHSNLLVANAWHNRGDMFTSVIVLISVALTWFGLRYFDAIGAAIIALFILKIGIKMIWNSINELVDAGVDEKTLEKIRSYIQNTSGVKAVHQLRTRLHGSNIFVDAHIQVQPKISVSEGHFISEQVLVGLMQTFKKITDVTVHIDPEDDETTHPSLDLLPRKTLEKKLEKIWKNLPGFNDIHHMHLHYLEGSLEIEVLMPIEITKEHDPDTLTKQYLQAASDIQDIKTIRLLFIANKD